jgi:hypothetical protein
MQAASTWRSLVHRARKGPPMENREIRYTVRTRIERNEWIVSIHPAGIEGARRVVTSPRERAELVLPEFKIVSRGRPSGGARRDMAPLSRFVLASRTALPHVDASRIVVAPDCGLKYLPRDIAFAKMRAMVEGAVVVRNELS